ncbi:unnamed protein product [Schistosoma turkestanicum]|nr:unnamed protein product [Schistosoma turkestanicum]
MKPVIDSKLVKQNKKSKTHKLEQTLLIGQNATTKSKTKTAVDSKKSKRQEYIDTPVVKKTTKSKESSLLDSNLNSDSKLKESNRSSSKKSRQKKIKNSTNHSSEQPASVTLSEDHCGASSRNCLSLLITNLPKHINYTMLKDAIPSATRLHLFRKSGKRLAFANFSTTDEYSNAVSRLEGLEFDGVKPSFKQVIRHDKNEKKKLDSGELRLTIRNLPYSTTETELQDEFPTAKSIIINKKENGISKGSCLIEFESHDDLQVVLDACQNKVIGGRRVHALPGLHFKLKSENSKANNEKACTFGIKICKLSTVIDDDRLRQQFPLGSIIEYCSVPTSNPSCRNVFLTLKNIASNQLIVKKLRRKGIDEHRLRIHVWCKKGSKSQKIDINSLTDDKKNKRKKPKLKIIVPVGNEETTFSDADKENKLKQRKLEKMDVSVENTEVLSSNSASKEHKLKKRKFECMDVNMTDSHSLKRPRSHKKKEFGIQDKNQISDNLKHIVFNEDE